MGRAYTMNGREVHAKVWGNLMKEEDLGVDGRIILKLILGN
jgi:hypothetical protein